MAPSTTVQTLRARLSLAQVVAIACIAALCVSNAEAIRLDAKHNAEAEADAVLESMSTTDLEQAMNEPLCRMLQCATGRSPSHSALKHNSKVRGIEVSAAGRGDARKELMQSFLDMRNTLRCPDDECDDDDLDTDFASSPCSGGCGCGSALENKCGCGDGEGTGVCSKCGPESLDPTSLDSIPATATACGCFNSDALDTEVVRRLMLAENAKASQVERMKAKIQANKALANSADCDDDANALTSENQCLKSSVKANKKCLDALKVKRQVIESMKHERCLRRSHQKCQEKFLNKIASKVQKLFLRAEQKKACEKAGLEKQMKCTLAKILKEKEDQKKTECAMKYLLKQSGCGKLKVGCGVAFGDNSADDTSGTRKAVTDPNNVAQKAAPGSAASL